LRLLAEARWEAFSKPKEEISKSEGRKFQGKGSEIQIFSFRCSRLFNGLSYESRKRSSSVNVRAGPTFNPGPTSPQHKPPFGLSQRIVEYFRGDAASCATSAEPGASRTTSAARIAASFRLSLRCRAT
jgi:hypothetical protein